MDERTGLEPPDAPSRPGIAERPRHGAARIEPWGAADLALLQGLLGDPAMMEHLGGPESAEKIAERHARYLRASTPGDRSFRIVEVATGAGAGWVGYWERTWREQPIYEVGWSVLPGFQGRGLAASAAALAIEAARTERARRFVHAFPAVDNGPSNAICRRLGFTLVEAFRGEYPPGHFSRHHDWRLELDPEVLAVAPAVS